MSEMQKSDHYQLQADPGAAQAPRDPDSAYSAQERDGYSRMAVADTAEKAGNEEATPSAGAMIRELLETIVLSLIIFLLIRQVIQNYRIESLSMEPNFYEGQFILVNKLAFRLGEPDRGEVVVFNNPSNHDEDYIKRIIGLPGDMVEIREQQVFINGEKLDEPYDTHPIPGMQALQFLVGPDEIFVMGDNRPNSSDGRAFGPFSQDLIVGKAWFRVWPPSDFGQVQHYALEPGIQPAGP